LKLLGYRVNDWLWIIQRFEKRISHWTYKYISLGGRLILIQSVLSSIHVYWMGLAPLPASILQKLRRIMFNFLWGSSNNNCKYHLASWKDLSWPKEHGGWGIKNLPWFNLALCLKTFWRILHSKGLWYQVLQFKYIKIPSVADWLRYKRFSTRNVSIMWRGFIHTLPWMGTHMAWQVGNGDNILLGIDPIVGSHSSFILPEDLRSYLEDLNICTLSHAHNSLINAQSYWFTANDLDLGGTFKSIWTEYVEGLSGACIRLTDHPDDLVWVYNKKSGSISAKNAYDCIVRSSSPPATNPVDSHLWNKALLNKISCFI